MLVLATVMLALVLMSCAARGQSSSTPSATGAIPVGDSTQTITVGGRSRTFHLYRPATLSDPAPLVVMLHGGFGSGSQAEKSYHWDDEANSGHFLVAYPDGVNRAWNTGGGCCGTPASQHIDDVGFLTHQQRRHHGIYIGLPDGHLRRDWTRLSHHARGVPTSQADLGHPHPRHRR
jgi:polyhydroxybutyrate depolymerase